ncbi:metal ABC transporter permease [candidate division KSB1 bacterium]|nr:metal ABC transporter permease [candidate division KSB1 bacterium]
MTAIEFMFAPFVACLLLIGINSYFGIHVIKREIIFIDIAMAQVAALGGTVAMILGFTGHEHAGQADGGFSLMGYLFAIAFTTIAAAIFTILKSRKLPIPLESLIGIAYAVAATGAVILLDKAAGGDVHVHEMVAGAILWVSWREILELFIVFALVGLFHFIFRKKFITLTDNYNKANHTNHNLAWDFLFYATFGIAVVHSVQIGGILTVFAFLIIPASISALFSERWVTRILIGWGLGTIVTIFGLYLSWVMDVPSSPTVILFLGVFLLIAVIFRILKKALFATGQ